MKFYELFFSTLLMPLALVSCGGSQGSSQGDVLGAERVIALDESSGQAALENKYADFGDVLETDEDGNMRIAKGARRSSFEGKSVSQIGGSRAKKEYNVERYNKKNWSGNKRYSADRYKGNTENRWQGAEWFLQKEANAAGKVARETGSNYGTRAYAAEAAREANQSSMGIEDAQSQFAGERVEEPLILTQEQYEQLSLNEVNRRLGR